jgi:hypothetical protein
MLALSWLLFLAVFLIAILLESLFIGWLGGIIIGSRPGRGRSTVVGIAALWIASIAVQLLALVLFAHALVSWTLFSIAYYDPVVVVAAIIVAVALQGGLRAIKRRFADL